MSGSKTKKCSTFLGDAGLLPALVTASWQDTSLFLTRGLAMVPRLPSYESFPWQFELSKHWGTFRHMLHSVRSIRQTRSVLKTVFSALRTTLRSSELSMCSLRMFKLKPESCARAAGQSFKKNIKCQRFLDSGLIWPRASSYNAISSLRSFCVACAERLSWKSGPKPKYGVENRCKEISG